MDRRGQAPHLYGSRPGDQVLLYLHERATRRTAADFLYRLIDTLSYKIHTVLTDNGTHFTAAEIKAAIEKGEPFRVHDFEPACAKANIDHRLTKPRPTAKSNA